MYRKLESVIAFVVWRPWSRRRWSVLFLQFDPCRSVAYGSLPFRCKAVLLSQPGCTGGCAPFSPLSWKRRMRGRRVDGLLSFFSGRVVISFQVPRTTPLKKLLLNMDSSSVLALGPSALRKVGGTLARPAAPLPSLMVTGEQQDAAVVGRCCVFFMWQAGKRSIWSSVDRFNAT